jgi:hypothetical protein
VPEPSRGIEWSPPRPHWALAGTKTWVLTLQEKGLRSRPVKDGRATPSTIVFEMEPMK